MSFQVTRHLAYSHSLCYSFNVDRIFLGCLWWDSHILQCHVGNVFVIDKDRKPFVAQQQRRLPEPTEFGIIPALVQGHHLRAFLLVPLDDAVGRDLLA